MSAFEAFMVHSTPENMWLDLVSKHACHDPHAKLVNDALKSATNLAMCDLTSLVLKPIGGFAKLVDAITSIIRENPAICPWKPQMFNANVPPELLSTARTPEAYVAYNYVIGVNEEDRTWYSRMAQYRHQDGDEEAQRAKHYQLCAPGFTLVFSGVLLGLPDRWVINPMSGRWYQVKRLLVPFIQSKSKGAIDARGCEMLLDLLNVRITTALLKSSKKSIGLPTRASGSDAYSRPGSRPGSRSGSLDRATVLSHDRITRHVFNASAFGRDHKDSCVMRLAMDYAYHVIAKKYEYCRFDGTKFLAEFNADAKPQKRQRQAGGRVSIGSRSGPTKPVRGV